MNTIDTEIWKDAETPGYITFDRTKTIGEWTTEVIAAFKELTPQIKYGVGEFEWFSASIDDCSREDNLPRDARMVCNCQQGASEGYIVNVWLLHKDEPATVLLVGKCFDAEYAWKAVRQLTELLGIMPQAGQPIVYSRCIIFPNEGGKP